MEARGPRDLMGNSVHGFWARPQLTVVGRARPCLRTAERARTRRERVFQSVIVRLAGMGY